MVDLTGERTGASLGDVSASATTLSRSRDEHEFYRLGIYLCDPFAASTTFITEMLQ